MVKFAHEHPGQDEPRSHGETHHENRIIDLNSAPEEQIADLPMVGKERARAICAARPFGRWADLEKVPGFGVGMIDDLKSGGAQIGSPQDGGGSRG
jgi:DNA uptake protein ComE-like DNA-binding protein